VLSRLDVYLLKEIHWHLQLMYGLDAVPGFYYVSKMRLALAKLAPVIRSIVRSVAVNMDMALGSEENWFGGCNITCNLSDGDPWHCPSYCDVLVKSPGPMIIV
jgi:hypothetical protein